MGDIIEFPTRATQGWSLIEQTLREIFQQAAAPIEMQDEVLAQMKEVFERYDVQFNVALELPRNLPQTQSAAVSSTVSRAFADYEKQLHDFMNSILLERLQIEIEMCKLRHEITNDT